jgi:hypothetical protein
VKSVVRLRLRTTDGTDFTDGTVPSLFIPSAVPLVPLIASIILRHGDDFTPKRKNQETYGRFWVRFILEGFATRFRFNRNYLQRKNSPKTEKTQNKVQNCFRQSLIFLQKKCLFS